MFTYFTLTIEIDIAISNIRVCNDIVSFSEVREV